MAFYYQDLNGPTPGFGTLNNSTAGSTIASCSTSNLGTAGTAAISFSSANQHELSFGSAATNNGTPGTFTLVSNGSAPFFRGLTFQNLTGNQSFVRGGAVTNFTTNCITMVGTNPYIDVSATGKLILSVTVSGSVNWEKRGATTLQLLQANNFSGGMTIAAGTVEIANASALGTGTVTMTGGKLSSSSETGYALANALTLNGTMTLGDAANTGRPFLNGTLTLAGNTTLSTPSSVVFNGTKTSSAAYNFSVSTSDALYFLGAAGTFSGGTATFTGSGAVLLADFASFSSEAPNQLTGFSTLTFNANAQINGSVTHTFANTIGGTGTVYVRNTSAAGITFNGSMASYTGSLRAYADSVEGANPAQKITLTRANQFGFASFWFQSGGGLTTLSQTLNYTGTEAVSTSAPIFLYLPGTNSFTTTYSNNSSNNSGITHSNVVEFNGFAGGNATFRLQATSGPFTFNAAVYDFDYGATGKLSVVKEGTYAATFAGGNGYRGSTAVNAGTLNANNATALGPASSTAALSVTSGATLSLGAAATYSSRTLAIGGTGVSSTVGALVVNHTDTSTFGSIQLGSPTNYIRATNDGLLDATFTPGGNSLILGAAAGVTFTPFANIAKVFSGIGSVTYGSQSADSGTVKADVRHTYTGNTTLSYGTTAIASSQELPGTGGPLGNKSLTAANTLLMDGGTLSYLDGNVDYSGRFSTAGGQQWRIAAGTATTFATALVGASSLRLFGGSLTLSSAASTFSGGVTLTEGTLYAGAAQNGVSGPLGITGSITFSPAGTGVLAYTSASASFDYSSRFATTNGQSRRINANGESVTFSTALGGTNALALVGSTGILTLAVANTYTQGTTLSVGTLKCGNVTSLGTGGLAQANGTTLHVTATGGKLTIQGAHTNTGSGSRTIRIGA
jgi:autotransporter-associated beta strand protein